MTTPDLRSAISAALEPTCRGEDICDTHAEVMYGDQCEDADRDLRDRIEAALAQPEPLDEADDMCPNCVTPWKCNGPHLDDQTPRALAARLSETPQ